MASGKRRVSTADAAGTSRRRGRPAPARDVADSSPSRYIARISRHRRGDRRARSSPTSCSCTPTATSIRSRSAAQFVASRLIQLTGREQAGGRGLRRMNTAGRRLAESAGQRSRAAAPSSSGPSASSASWTAPPTSSSASRPTSASSEVRARVERLQREAAGRCSRARGPQPAAAGPAHRRHGLRGQGDPRPGGGRPAHRGGRGGGAAGDGPRPEDEGGR